MNQAPPRSWKSRRVQRAEGVIPEPAKSKVWEKGRVRGELRRNDIWTDAGVTKGPRGGCTGIAER